MASSSRGSRDWSSSAHKTPWNPVLKTDRPKYGYASEVPKKEPETPRAPEKRPAVPRFRHPPPQGEQLQELSERRPAVPRFRHPPEREDKDHPLLRGSERPWKRPESLPLSEGDRSELRPVKCRYCSQLLVLATQQQHERSCFERMLTDLVPNEGHVPHRSRSNSSDLNHLAAPSWAPTPGPGVLGPVPLRLRAQGHQQAVHTATKEAMMAEEEDPSIVLTVDALEEEFKSLVKELTSLALPRSALALLGQLQGVNGTGLDQLIDLQRRHSVLGSILRLSEEHRTSKPPPFGPQPLPPHTPTGWPPPPNLSYASDAETPRRNRAQQLPPLELEPPRHLSRSSSRGSLRSTSVASVRSGRRAGPEKRKGRSRASSVRSARSAAGPEGPEVRASPGPAAVGVREMSMEEMKAEIEAERRQYIAERLSTC